MKAWVSQSSGKTTVYFRGLKAVNGLSSRKAGCIAWPFSRAETNRKKKSWREEGGARGRQTMLRGYIGTENLRPVMREKGVAR